METFLVSRWVGLWQPTGNRNQFWRILPTVAGFFKLVATLGGKALDVRYGKVEPGASLIQWADGAGDHQQWSAVERELRADSTELAGGVVADAPTAPAKPLRVKAPKSNERALVREFGLDVIALTEEEGVRPYRELKALGIWLAPRPRFHQLSTSGILDA